MDISFLKGMGTRLKIVSFPLVKIFGLDLQFSKVENSKTLAIPFGSEISIRNLFEAVAKTPNTLSIIVNWFLIEWFESGDDSTAGVSYETAYAEENVPTKYSQLIYITTHWQCRN